MTPERLVRLTVITALLNFAMTSTLLFGRPDLAVRESSEKIFIKAAELEKQGKFPEAAELYESIFTNMSSTLLAPRAGERLADIYRRQMLDIDRARQILRESASFKGSAYADKARTDLEFMDRHWGADGSGLKLWYDASKSYRSGQKDHAIEVLKQIIESDAYPTLKPLAMMKVATIHKEQKRNEEAARVLRAFLGLYPKDTGAAEARAMLSSLSAQ